jgi:hypothetical protein
MLRTMISTAAATALVWAPAMGAVAGDGSGVVRASICAEAGRRVVLIDFGEGQPDKRKHGAPCHAACLADRKAPRLRGAR